MGANLLILADSLLPRFFSARQQILPNRRLVPRLIFAAALVGCRREVARLPTEGHLDVSWTGKERGTVSGPATARWCGLRQVLEIQRVQGDTGVAVAIYPGAALKPGTYRVVDPAIADSSAPTAAVALRWLGQTVVQGFQGESGRVVLQRSSTGLFSGNLSARARSVVDTQHLDLTGTFRDLPLRRDTLGCAPREEEVDEDAEAADTGVH